MVKIFITPLKLKHVLGNMKAESELLMQMNNPTTPIKKTSNITKGLLSTRKNSTHLKRYQNTSNATKPLKKDILDYTDYENSLLANNFAKRCLEKIDSDNEMQEIVKLYSLKVKELRETDEKELKRSFLELCPKFETIIKELDKYSEKLPELGLDLNSYCNTHCSYVKKADNKIGFTFSSEKIVYDFKTCVLTKDQVLSGKNVYQENLDQFIIQNPNLKEKLDTKRKELNRLTKRKSLPFFGKRKTNLLTTLEQEILDLSNLYERECELKKYAQSYSHLTQEQKYNLANYLTKKEEFEQLCNQVDKLKKYAMAFYGIDHLKECKQIVQKRVEEAKNALPKEIQEKINTFCKNLANSFNTASEYELIDLKPNIKEDITTSYDIACVYKALCIEIKNNFLDKNSEHKK